MLKFHNLQILEEGRFIYSYKSTLLLSNITRQWIGTFNILPRAFDRVSCPGNGGFDWVGEFELDFFLVAEVVSIDDSMRLCEQMAHSKRLYNTYFLEVFLIYVSAKQE